MLRHVSPGLDRASVIGGPWTSKPRVASAKCNYAAKEVDAHRLKGCNTVSNLRRCSFQVKLLLFYVSSSLSCEPFILASLVTDEVYC